jgi:hypothetical protein
MLSVCIHQKMIEDLFRRFRGRKRFLDGNVGDLIATTISIWFHITKAGLTLAILDF